jgi:uncharacterized membrane protein
MSLWFWRIATLMTATVTMGLMAGVFGVYAHAIMRGLTKTDDRTFVGAFQATDRAIMNPLFLLTFMGALLLTGVAGVLYLWGDDGGSVVPWVAVAFGLYLAVFVITMVVHVPLNDDLKAAGDPDRIADLASVRDAFHETRWMAWNVVRALASTAAFICLAWALVLHGRADADRGDDADQAGARREITSHHTPT